MSWPEAKESADRIYADLRKDHSVGFAGMVIDALRRIHARQKNKPHPENNRASSVNYANESTSMGPGEGLGLADEKNKGKARKK